MLLQISSEVGLSAPPSLLTSRFLPAVSPQEAVCGGGLGPAASLLLCPFPTVHKYSARFRGWVPKLELLVRGTQGTSQPLHTL